MAFLLRKIRKPRWYKQDLPWVAANDIPPDPLGDLTTSENKLSVWYVKNDKSNLDQVLAAIAASSGSLSNLDYALFNEHILSEFKIEQSLGGTPYDTVNTFYHRDLTELSGLRLVKLAKAILTNAERKRVPEKESLKLINEAVTSGGINRKKLQDGIKVKIS